MRNKNPKSLISEISTLIVRQRLSRPTNFLYLRPSPHEHVAELTNFSLSWKVCNVQVRNNAQNSWRGNKDRADIPAPGVIQTRPVIMPWTAPITEGLLKNMTSNHVHTRRLVAAQMLVLRTAMEESILALYGSPPLKPAHPIHSNPAPANISSTLFGGNLSLSFFDLGPTCKKYINIYMMLF